MLDDGSCHTFIERTAYPTNKPTMLPTKLIRARSNSRNTWFVFVLSFVCERER